MREIPQDSFFPSPLCPIILGGAKKERRKWEGRKRSCESMRRLRFPQLPNHQPAPWDSPRIFQAYISKEEGCEYSAVPHTSPNRHLPPPWRQRTNERHHHQGRQRGRKRGGRGGDLSGKWIDDAVLLDSSSPCMSEPPSPLSRHKEGGFKSLFRSPRFIDPSIGGERRGLCFIARFHRIVRPVA